MAGTRIPLASVACAFKDGESPECIRRNFPALSLEQVYGAITFCLAHPAEVNAYLRWLERRFEDARAAAPALPAALQARLGRARRRRQGAGGLAAAAASE